MNKARKRETALIYTFVAGYVDDLQKLLDAESKSKDKDESACEYYAEAIRKLDEGIDVLGKIL